MMKIDLEHFHALLGLAVELAMELAVHHAVEGIGRKLDLSVVEVA
jgi:hypothetical protein